MEEEFVYPFKDKGQEKQNEMLKISIMDLVTKKGGKASLHATYYKGGIVKYSLREDIYVKDGKDKPGDVLYFRPKNQVRMKRYTVIDALIYPDGRMEMSREKLLEVASFTDYETSLILLIYQYSNVPLKHAAVLTKYSTKESVKSAVNTINRKFISLMGVSKNTKLMSGDWPNGYSFNKTIKLNITDQRTS